MQQKHIAGLAVILVVLLFLGAYVESVILSYLTGGHANSLRALFESLPGKWKVIVIFMMPIALLAVAIGVLYVEVLRARFWVGAPGKIVSAKSVQRKVVRSRSSANDEDYEMRNFAEISYAYEVAGKAYTGSRLSVGSDLGNSGVAEKLARYKPKTAVTVYYNPRNPENAVIERDLPDGAFRAGVGIVAGLTALLFTVVFGADFVAKVLNGRLPNPHNGPIVTALALFAGFIALFGLGMRWQAAAVDRWAQTKGTILGSQREAFGAGVDRMSAPSRTLHRQRVTFGYSVAGVAYSSDRVSMGARTSSTIKGMEQAILERYPVGKSVTVYYDPANPSQAVLERGVRWIWLVWASAALFAVMAVAISGVLD